MTTKCFKIITGEQVLADVLNETKEFVQLKNPVVLAMVGEGQLGLMPWVPLAEKPEVTLDTKNVILSYIPKQELINHYKTRTGGIVTAGPGVLGQLDDWRN